MFRRQFVLIALILANFSIGFTQSLGDFARDERARRNSFVTAANPTNTVATSDASETLITEAVRISGAKRELQETLETFRPSLAGEKRPNDVSVQAYQGIINEALGLDRMTQLMERSVSETVNDNTLTNIVRWYGSALGRKIASAERNAYSQEVPARFQRYAAMLQEKAPTANRQELVEGIGASGLGIPRPPVDFDNDSWLVFVYDSLTDVELSGYLAFLNSPSATAFNTAIWTGIDAAFSDAAQHFQERLAEKKPR
jgi:hypothetical protein